MVRAGGLALGLLMLAAIGCGNYESSSSGGHEVAKHRQASILVVCGTYDWWITTGENCWTMSQQQRIAACTNNGGCESTRCMDTFGELCYLYEVGDAWCETSSKIWCRCACHRL